MEAIFVNQRNPNMMYLFEPLRSLTNCMVYIIDGFSDHSWPPNSLKTSKMQYMIDGFSDLSWPPNGLKNVNDG